MKTILVKKNMELVKINNYTIILIHSSDAQTTYVESILNHGMASENKFNLGISHLTEHVVASGWQKNNISESDFWKTKGVSKNAWTFQTGVGYHINGLNKYQNDMIDYIVDITTKPIISQKRISKEKIAVKNELLNHLNDPEYKIFNKLNSMVFANEGMILQDNCNIQIDNLKGLNLKEVSHWISLNYTPENTVFIISGNLNKSKIKNKLNGKLNKFKNKCLLPSDRYFFKQGFELDFIKNTKNSNSTLLFSFFTNIVQGNIQYKYLEVLKNFLSRGSSSSILMNILREKLSLIYNCRCNIYNTKYGTQFVISIKCENKNIKDVVKNTIDVINLLKKGNYSNDIFESSKNEQLRNHYESCKNTISMANHYSSQIVNNLGDRNIKLYTQDELTAYLKKMNKQKLVEVTNSVLDYSKLKFCYMSNKEIKNLINLFP